MISKLFSRSNLRVEDRSKERGKLIHTSTVPAERMIRVQLLAENPDYPPIDVAPEEFALEGLVVGLIRQNPEQ